MSDFSRLMEAAREAGAAISAPGVVDLPAITGTGLVAEVLTCAPGVWTNAPTDFAYQWRSDGAPIADATADTYTVAAGDVSHSLDCSVTATNAAGSGTAVAAAIVVTGTREAPGEPPAEAKVEPPAEAKEPEPEPAPAHEQHRGTRR